MKTAAWLAARVTALGIFFATWAYGVTTYSAFVFDMFVKPRLFEPLNAFADWQHAWFTAAYLLSSATLLPIIRGRGVASRRRQLARGLAVGYAALFGGVALWLLANPYLPRLTAGSEVLAIVPGALLPPIWLALIDHLAAPEVPRTRSRAATTGDCFMAAIATAAVLSLSPILGRLATGAPSLPGGMLPLAWAVSLNVATFAIGAMIFWCLSAVTATRRHRAAWEYAAGVAFLAIAIEELVRQIILPPIGFAAADRAMIAAPFAIAISLTVSGLALRRGARSPADGLAGILGVTSGNRFASALTVIVVAVAATAAIQNVTRIDWASIMQQCIAFIEGLLIFGTLLSLWRARDRPPAPPLALMVGLAAGAVLSLQTLARVSESRSGMPVQATVEQAAQSDTFAHLASAVFVPQAPIDVGFYTTMNQLDATSWMRSPETPPSLVKEPLTPAASLPNVFVVVVDSLRRDYLSVYNPAVTFTPAIDAWARDSDVFTNAFTPHGGTLLAAPALWAGRPVPRGWASRIRSFDLLETIITRLGFDFLLNDSPTEEFLRQDTKVIALDPFVPRVQTDLCQNLSALVSHLRDRRGGPPVFAYMQPMNLHILNTLVSNGERDYPGFYAPYAARLERIDQCFGSFISYLKTSGLYDNSIIMLSSDHGDMLGEDGRWGHQAFLLPQVVRVPLIVRLPPALAATRTTDLGRVAMITDIAPTLLSLLTTSGAADDSPPNGATLYAPRGGALRPRDRDSFLLIASYGPTYGVLSGNGRELYAIDLAKVREYEFQIDASGPHELSPSAGRLRMEQSELAARLDEFRRLYDRH